MRRFTARYLVPLHLPDISDRARRYLRKELLLIYWFIRFRGDRAVYIAALAALCLAYADRANATEPPIAAPSRFWSSPSEALKPALRHEISSAGSGAATASRELGLIASFEDDDSLELQMFSSIYGKSADPYLELLYWNYACDAASSIGDDQWIVNAANKILASPIQSPLLRAYAKDSLAYALNVTGKSAAADSTWASFGFVRSWHVIGPFDNASLSGFDRSYGPENGVDYSKSYTGADSELLHWHPLAIVDRDGTVEVGESLSSGDGSVYYASTAIDSPTAGPVTLQFSVIGASKIYVNGELVSRDPIYRNATEWSTDNFAPTVMLKKGWNTVLLKLADNEKSDSNFRLRLTDRVSGASLNFANRSVEANHVPAVSDKSDIRPATPTRIALIKERIAAKPDDLVVNPSEYLILF